jgi:thiaminase (transcriptional activator TenA)
VSIPPGSSMERWSLRLWEEIESTFDAILAHPFISGLIDGTLDSKVFGHYVAQDVHFLRDYSRALAVIATKAPTLADTAMFARHSAAVYDDELALHETLLPALGMKLETVAEVPVAQTTLAYTSYLLATAYSGSFADGVAAILPCYWIYARLGERLLASGSADARYQRWIDSYGGDDFANTVAEVLALTDRVGPTLTPADEAAARAHFANTARYEWMFFDAAYLRETWPL